MEALLIVTSVYVKDSSVTLGIKDFLSEISMEFEKFVAAAVVANMVLYVETIPRQFPEFI